MIRKTISTATRLLLGAAAFLVLGLTYAWMSHRMHVENPSNKTIPNFEQLQEGWEDA